MTDKPVNEMTNDEFFNFVVNQGLKGWVPLETYLRIFPEESKEAIETRIKRRHWLRGVHYTTPKGSRMWVNIIAIGAWVQAQADADRD